MALLKRNIWTLFFIILFGGAVLLAVILHFRWLSILSDYKVANMNKVDVSSLAVDSVFRTQELVLDVLGRDIIEHAQDLQERTHLHLLDNILDANPALMGFGLANIDGELTHVSSNMDIDQLPNLRRNPDTKQSFDLALERQQMVVGRTYFLEAVGAWVIPLRKAIRNKKGKVQAVMTAGMRLEDGDVFFAKTRHQGPYDSFMLFREDDGYVQFLSKEGVSVDIYSKILVSLEQRKINREEFVKALGRSIEDIKSSGDVVHIETERRGTNYLTAASFNPRFQIWTVSEVEFTPLYRDFFWSVLIYSGIATLISLVLFFWFRVIDSAEQKRRRELYYLSRHDDLTGLRNRIGLIDRLDELFSKKKPFSIAIININQFRTVNDRYGLDTGDYTLKAFSLQLIKSAGNNDNLARLGADEFSLILPDESLASAIEFCRKISSSISRNYEINTLSIPINVSIGIATYPAHGEQTSELIRSAHLALYDAKDKECTVGVYRSEMETAYLRRLQVEQRLRVALCNNDLFMTYQLQVDDKQRVIGMEALARWHDSELGFISPQEFVLVAEQSGLMLSLGEYILHSCLRDYAEWILPLSMDVTLSINISIIQFKASSFLDQLDQLLREFSIPSNLIQLEITESLFMDDLTHVKKVMDQIRSKGIRLSMDDFGTGFSSLGLLRTLDIDELKIDKSFIDSINQDVKTESTVKSIIAIANSHHLNLISEGIETRTQMEQLIQLGCTRFQGYLFHKPEKAEVIVKRLSSGLKANY